MANSKYYVVWEGHLPGIYRSWADCQTQTKHYPQAKFKSFETLQEAEQAYHQGRKSTNVISDIGIEFDSVSVDVGCLGNPGIVEYKGVDTRTGEILFHKGPIGKGTNNLGEFLAIVHALAYLKSINSNKTIYTDSVTALSWIRKQQVSTNLVRDETTAEMWQLVDRALDWLRHHTYTNRILKWDTKKHGEIKADFGRK